ncbi:MAG: sugar transferase [Chloroflexota bacterium]
MFKRFSTNYLAIFFFIDVLIIQFALWAAVQLRFVLPFGQALQAEWVHQWVYVPDLGMKILITSLWALNFFLFSCYTPHKILRWVEEFQQLILAHTVAALSLAGILYLLHIDLARLTYLYFYVIAIGLLLFSRTVTRLWYRLRPDDSSVARLLLVGTGELGQQTVEQFQKQEWPGIKLVGFVEEERTTNQHLHGLPILGHISQITGIIHQHDVDEVIVALPRERHINLANVVAGLHELPVRVRVIPDYFDLIYHNATVLSLGGIPMIGLRDPAIENPQRFAKRLLDIVVSLLVMLAISPIYAVVSLLIKLEDRGPIFYLSPRIGENGQLFNMYKFRSMVVNADKLQVSVNETDDQGQTFHKSPNDPRITRIGRFIRNTSVDELPQLLNVLKGEMSLVGPRPELPWLVDQYEPWQRKRFAVPQGMTGWWQVNGRSDNLMHLHTEQDLYYIQNYSLWLDIQILWRTVGVVFRGTGAY